MKPKKRKGDFYEMCENHKKLTTAEKVAQYYNHCDKCGEFLKNDLLFYGLCYKCTKDENETSEQNHSIANK
jgi:hypothetical protein